MKVRLAPAGFGPVRIISSPKKGVPLVPQIQTRDATNKTQTTATLNALVWPNGQTTWVRFYYDTLDYYNNPTGPPFRYRTQDTSVGPLFTPVSVSHDIGGSLNPPALVAGTTYIFVADCNSIGGVAQGGLTLFDTPPAGGPPGGGSLPVVSAALAGSGSTSINLSGFGTPNGSPARGFFEYRPTNPAQGPEDNWEPTYPTWDTEPPVVPPLSGINIGSGSSPVLFRTQGINQYPPGGPALLPDTDYDWRATVRTGPPSNTQVWSSVQVIRTQVAGGPPAVPDAVTLPATGFVGTSVVLNGTVDANDSSACEAWFEYVRVPDPGADIIFPVMSTPHEPVSGTLATPIDHTVDNLLVGVTYQFRMVALSSGGGDEGDWLLFTITGQAGGFLLKVFRQDGSEVFIPSNLNERLEVYTQALAPIEIANVPDVAPPVGEVPAFLQDGTQILVPWEGGMDPELFVDSPASVTFANVTPRCWVKANGIDITELSCTVYEAYGGGIAGGPAVYGAFPPDYNALFTAPAPIGPLFPEHDYYYRFRAVFAGGEVFSKDFYFSTPQ